MQKNINEVSNIESVGAKGMIIGEPIMGVGKTRCIDSLYASKQNQRKEPMTISFFEVAKWLESQRLRGLKKNKIYKNKSARF